MVKSRIVLGQLFLKKV